MKESILRQIFSSEDKFVRFMRLSRILVNQHKQIKAFEDRSIVNDEINKFIEIYIGFVIGNRENIMNILNNYKESDEISKNCL